MAERCILAVAGDDRDVPDERRAYASDSVREDGVQFDQIVLSPTTYLTSPPGGVSNDSTIVPKP